MQTFVSLRTHFACFASQVYTSTSVFMHGTECIVADRCSITLVRTADSLHVTYVLVFELIVAGAEMSRLWRALVDVAQVYRYQINVVRHEAVEAVTLQRFQETHVYQRCSVKNTLIGLQQKKEIKYAHIFLTKSNNTATKCIHLYYTTKLTRHLQFSWKRNLYMDVQCR